MADSLEDIKKKRKTYLLVGLFLFVGTVLTYLVATQEALDVGRHGFDIYDCILGFAIATAKAFLVAYIFMHLNHEKPSVYWIFFGSLLFAVFLGGLTAMAYYDPIHDRFFPGAAPGYIGQPNSTVP